MRSYFLLGVASEAKAKEALSFLLPGQEQPWLLRSIAGDLIAYITVGSQLDGEPNIHVQADISGRHFRPDVEVLELLRALQVFVGGIVSNDA